MAPGIALSVLRSEWHRRIGWIASLSLTIALGGGVAIGALVVAHRTDRAYPDYVERANVGELSINPSISTRVMDEQIRTLPGVESVHSSSLLFASVSELQGGTFGDLAASTEPAFLVWGSTDGQFVDADRPAISSGRLPTGTDEVFVGEDARTDLVATIGHDLQIGDTFPMAFWWSAIDDQDDPPDPDQVVAPIGVEQLRIVGFGRLPDEILPDELYSRDRLIVSADVAGRYSSAFDIPPDVTAETSSLKHIIPDTCSTDFIYYSLELGGSGGDVDSVRAAYSALAQRLTDELPSIISERHGYEQLAQTRADLDAGVRQTTRPTVAALIVFAIVAALATLAVVSLSIARSMRRDEREHVTMLAIGATGWQRGLIAAAAPIAGSTAGLIGATLVAGLISPIGPLGVVRDLDTSPGLSLPPGIVLLALGVTAAALLVVIGALATMSARRTAMARRRVSTSSWRANVFDRGSRPAMTTGIRATFGSNSSWTNAAVLIGCVVAIAAVASATIFGTNLSSLVTQPDRYGWPWDAATITNAGYGSTDPDAVDARRCSPTAGAPPLPSTASTHRSRSTATPFPRWWV